MQELKEPLISQGTKDAEKNGFLKSYLKDLYPSMFKSTKGEQPDEDKGENYSEQNQKELEDQAPTNYQPTDFSEKASNYINRVSY